MRYRSRAWPSFFVIEDDPNQRELERAALFEGHRIVFIANEHEAHREAD